MIESILLSIDDQKQIAGTTSTPVRPVTATVANKPAPRFLQLGFRHAFVSL